MNIVFIHQNFPGQFRHIAKNLASDPANCVISISQEHAPRIKGLHCVTYKPVRKTTKGIHPYIESTEAYVLNGQGVARALLVMKQKGFRPDVIFAHTGWGEALYIKDVFPDCRVVGLFEFFYRAHGADVGFDPEYPLDLDGALRVRTRNAIHLLSLDAVDLGVTPTRWQRSVFPSEYWPKLSVVHEGVNTALKSVINNPVLQLPDGKLLTADDQVVTYVARNLEPYRGFHIFMRSVEEISERYPKAHIVILGGDDVSYSGRLGNGETYRQRALNEVKIDKARVHFLGRVPYETYLNVLGISSAHVYLTVPFVLSWSMLEAMSAGCLVIGSDTSPVQEVISHGENGILVDFFSTDEISSAVGLALERPDDYSELREAGRQTIIDNYSIAQGLSGYKRIAGLN